jgi:hypothetical protein
VLSVEVTIDDADSQYSGIAVYNQQNNLCGQVLNVTSVGETYTFSCAGSYTNTTNPGSKMAIRFIGAGSIWDAPEYSLDVPYTNDPLSDELYISEVNSYAGIGDVTPLISAPNKYFNLLAGYTYDPLDRGDIYLPFTENAWPQRQGNFNNTFQTGVTVRINYTSSTVILGSEAGKAWDNITENIILNNQYPYNAPLQANVERLGLTAEDVDINNPVHQDYLYGVGSVYLFAPKCGASNTQCQTFGRGDCVFPDDETVSQPWWQGERDQEVIGKEGGCRCYDQFDRGYTWLEVGCQRCKPGYGPYLLQDLNTAYQYNQLIAPIFDVNSFPWATYLDFFSNAPSASPTLPTQFPTANPTGSPTSFPTVSPTRFPSDMPSYSPTNSPTEFNEKTIILFNYAYFISTGFGKFWYPTGIKGNSIGDRAASDELCRNQAGNQNIACNSNSTITALLGYVSDEVKDFPTKLNFDPFISIVGQFGNISTNWTYAFSAASGDLIDNDLYSATISPILQDLGFGQFSYWTGLVAPGTSTSNINCLDWQGNSTDISIGESDRKDFGWVFLEVPSVDVCDQEASFVCMCVGNATETPTPQPTNRPTSFPVEPTNSPTFPLPTLAPTLTPTGAPTETTFLQFFFDNIFCRFPVGKDPVVSSLQDIVICAGHGVVSYTQEQETFTVDVYPDTLGNEVMPKCREVFIDNDRYLLSDKVTDISSLMYVRGDDIVVVLNNALYIENDLCVLQTCTQSWPYPFACTFECGGVLRDVFCLNEILWDSDGREVTNKENGEYIYPTNKGLWSFYFES